MPDKKYSFFGVHALRLFMWGILQDELDWKKSDYRGAIPILTPGQQQEFNDHSSPYIVYSFATGGSGQDWLMREEQAVFTIYGGDEAQIREVLGLFHAHFEAYDESAQNVNKWLEDNAPLRYFETEEVPVVDGGVPVVDIHGNPVTEELKKEPLPRIDFKSIRLTSLVSPQPVVIEGGKTSGLIGLSYKYTYPSRVEFQK